MASIPCPNCRQPLPANARFCANCGAQLQMAAPGGPPQAGPAFGPPASVSAPAVQAPGNFPPLPPPQPAPGPQGFGPPQQSMPQQSFGPPPGAPPQGFGPPLQGPGAPPQGSGQPSQPGMPPAPQGFGPLPQGFGPPFQPGGAMPPAPMPAPKKRRTGLIVGGALLALVVLVAAVVGGIILFKKGGSNTGAKGGTGTPTVVASPSPSGPAGFQTFSNSTFSINYPQNWQKQETPGAQQDDVQFLSIPSKTFTVDVLNQTRQPKAEDDTRCKGFVGKTASVSSITLGKQRWTREDCGSGSKVPGITMHAIVESVIYKNKLYVITYTSTPADTFSADQTKYYLPMEQSFTFLT